MSSTNTVQHYLAVGLHGLADVVSAIQRNIPMEAQDAANISVALNAVHDTADKLSEAAASMPQTGITKDEIIPDVIRAFGPLLPGMIADAVQAHAATAKAP